MIPRRALLAAGPLALAACGKAEEAYFGKTTPPRSQRLVYLLGAEPATLDPVRSNDLWEAPVIHAMFEGLTTVHSATGEPVAALATHYQVSRDGLRYMFWLRGHLAPRGTPLSAVDGRELPAQWSDGRPITAHDFVYSWRRAVDPATAAMEAYQFHYVRNAQRITRGTAPPETLSVNALDDFSLEVQLEVPAPFFLRLVASRQFFATPRQAIEQARRRGDEDSWTQPENIVTSGAFTLREQRPHERIVLVRRNSYYDVHRVSLEEIVFLPVVDGSTSANLYRAGSAAFSMPMLPPVLTGLRHKKDVRTYPNFGVHFNVFNTTKPPFNDVRLRYALSMAVDKRAIAAFFGDGRTHLTGLIPPLKGYEAPKELPVAVDSTSVDVLSYDPKAARGLLAKAGYARGLSIEYLFPAMAEFKLVAEILQHQWRSNLGIDVRLICQDVRSWVEAGYNVAYKDIAAWGEISALEDPTSFLNMFTSVTQASGTGWSHPQYDDALAAAKAIGDPALRMRKLADCERILLEAMPCTPLYSDVWVYLCKPFVKGLVGDPFHGRMFNDAWIDTNWRPS